MDKLPALAVCLVLVGGAGSAQEKDEERRSPRMDISVFAGDFDLEEVEFDDTGTFGAFGTVDLDVERERAGARFAFGGESARGYFHLISEEWTVDSLAGSGLDQFDAFGVGGGVRGAPPLNDGGSGFRFLIPYRADLSLMAGTEEVVESGGSDADAVLVYLELHAEIGFGVEWRGLRPSAGIQLSSLAGVMVVDGDIDGDGEDDEFDLNGSNVGTFVEVYYKHPKFPVYARARAGGGDYDASEFAIGVAW